MADDTKPAIGLSMNVQLDKAGQRTIVFQTHVPQDASEGEINALFDLAFRTTRRQEHRYFVVEMTEQLKLREKELKFAKADIARLDAKAAQDWVSSGKTGTPKFRGNEETQRNNALVNIRRLEAEIEWFYGKVREVEDEINARGITADSSPDNR